MVRVTVVIGDIMHPPFRTYEMEVEDNDTIGDIKRQVATPSFHTNDMSAVRMGITLDNEDRPSDGDRIKIVRRLHGQRSSEGARLRKSHKSLLRKSHKALLRKSHKALLRKARKTKIRRSHKKHRK